ncbi:MAG: glycoside hydrolase family 97 protein [Candidatus Sumerlaeaceae bacterium]
MSNRIRSFNLVILLFLSSSAVAGLGTITLRSPGEKLQLQFALDADGRPTWAVTFEGTEILAPSRLGLTLLNARPLEKGFQIADTKFAKRDATYTLPVGKTRRARDHYRELAVSLQESTGSQRKLQLVFRAYDDAIAFRYVLPAQPNVKDFKIAAENTEFHFPGDAACWALRLKSFTTAYESEYEHTSVSLVQPGAFVGLPFTVQQPGGPTVLLAEARLKDWAGMYLHGTTTGSTTLVSRLSPSPSQPSVCVQATAPHSSPWRVVLVASQPGKLIESTTILNLNDPCAIADTSWIRPGKTAWDWWSGPAAPGEKFTPGTNNDTIKHYIDFASEMGLEYMLVDEGWYADKNSRKKKQFDFDLTKTVPDIDLPMLIEYGRMRNVGLILWMHWITTSRQMDTVFPYLAKLGIKGVKVDFMDRDDQEMIDFYHRILSTAAKNRLLINLHGAYKPTGLTRTYPNYITQEGVMGAEYNKWSKRVTATHNLTLPFTRMVPGPMDYTPGGFNNVTPQQFEKKSTEPMVMSTRAHQLAMFVVYESPLQMVSDFPGAYRGQPGVEFLKVVPANWDETRVLAGEIGQYIVVARRAGKRWFIGAMTNESSRKLSVPLDFLGRKSWQISQYMDGADAASKPVSIISSMKKVRAGQALELDMAPSGGFAAILE